MEAKIGEPFARMGVSEMLGGGGFVYREGEGDKRTCARAAGEAERAAVVHGDVIPIRSHVGDAAALPVIEAAVGADVLPALVVRIGRVVGVEKLRDGVGLVVWNRKDIREAAAGGVGAAVGHARGVDYGAFGVVDSFSGVDFGGADVGEPGAGVGLGGREDGRVGAEAAVGRAVSREAADAGVARGDEDGGALEAEFEESFRG